MEDFDDSVENLENTLEDLKSDLSFLKNKARSIETIVIWILVVAVLIFFKL